MAQYSYTVCLLLGKINILNKIDNIDDTQLLYIIIKDKNIKYVKKDSTIPTSSDLVKI